MPQRALAVVIAVIIIVTVTIVVIYRQCVTGVRHISSMYNNRRITARFCRCSRDNGARLLGITIQKGRAKG